jgi:two-component system phosphate regulon sensor histidine kinase PhoR
MKYHRPRVIASINAVIITLTGLVLNLVFIFLFKSELHMLTQLLYLIVSTGLIFLCTWLVCRFTLERFIYSKIRLIYKSIHKIKAPKEKAPVMMKEVNLLEHVSREVEQWKVETLQEIAKLKQLETYRKEFLGNVAHELRNPIFTIQGYILTLLDGAINDPEINLEYLKRTEKNVNRLITVVEDLDAIAQLEAGELKLNLIQFDIVALTKEVLDSFEMKARKNEIAFDLHEQSRIIMVKGDRERIHQVLTNLIDNAIRYRKTEHSMVKIAFFDMDEHILIEITDNGIGIDLPDIPRIFERFYRTEKGRVAFNKGKGLGLAIVKHLIEAHGQTIHVRSTLGVGTTIGFTLQKGV